MKRSKEWIPIIRNFKKLVLCMNLCLIFLLGSAVSVMANEKEVSGDILVDSSSSIQQEERTITGTITDANGGLLPGVAVVIKGTTLGTITNFDGVYTLTVPNDAKVLQVSFIGFKTQDIEIGTNTKIDFVLREENVGIKEVLVVAYGAQKKESVVGAISQVKGDALERTGQSTISNALSGQAPGVVTVQQSGLPGQTDAKIYIRGQSSFKGDNQPLVLVDGIERSMSNIDPSEVQSISVLKDASATAVYGVKGANGVILVTTKRGQLGKMEISASVEQTFTKPSLKRSLENSYNTLTAINKIYRNKQEWDKVRMDVENYKNPQGLDKYIYPDFDPSDLLTKNWGRDSKVNISARGGTKTLKYFVSLGAVREGGLFKDTNPQYDAGYNHNRYTFRMNFDFTLTKTTTAKVSSGGNIGQTNTPNGPYQYIPNYILFNAPYDSPYIYPAEFVEKYPDVDWPYAGDRLAGSLGDQSTTTPYYMHNYTGSRRRTNHRMGSDLEVTQKLDFITEGLSATATVSYNTYAYYNAGNINYTADYFFFNYTDDENYDWIRYLDRTEDTETIVRPAFNSSVSRADNPKPKKNVLYQARLDYRHSFGGAHNVSGLALFKRRESQNGGGFKLPEEEWAFRSTYDFKNKYLLELSMGVSGSPRFAPDYRFGYFPSFAIGWNLSKEEFIKKMLPDVNNFKVRYSYGETGQDNVNSFLYLAEYLNSKSYDLGGIGNKTEYKTVKEDKVPNMAARWERAIKNNLGLEIGLFNNTYTLSVDFFNEKRDGILLARQSISALFGQDTKEQNIGEVKKHGYEIDFGYSKDFNKIKFWAKANFNFNENRIVSKDEPFFTPDYLKQEGKPIGQNRSALNLGYYQNMDELLNYSVGMNTLHVVGRDKVLDFNGDGVINGNDSFAQAYSSRPNYTFGISSGVSVGNFDFNVTTQGAYMVTRNAQKPNPISSHEKQGILISGTSDDVWTPNNRNAEYANWGVWNGQQKNKIHTKFYRLKSAELGYRIKGGFIDRIGLSSARVYVQGTNLLTYAPEVKIGDPEAEGKADGAEANNNYPLPKRINLGVKINF